jgi:hypothetical protein
MVSVHLPVNNESSGWRQPLRAGSHPSIMPTITPLYRLVIFEAIDEPAELRDLVCRVTKMDEATVRDLLAGFYEAGIAAEAWRTDLFPDLSPPRTIHRAACTKEGFRIEGLRGEPTHWMPWDRVELICAGRISVDDEFRDVQAPRWPSTMVAGIRALALMKPQPTNRRARASRVPSDPLGEAFIIRREPRIAFRVVENQMNYAYLGDRLSQSAADNFPVFVADLCARADDAYITESTRSLLERRQPGEHGFPSSQALLEYATHRLLWSWYRRDRDARASDGARGTDRDDRPTRDDEVEPP